MTQKIAINKDFGGFAISDQAFEMFLSLKNIEFEATETSSAFIGKNYWAKGHAEDEEYYLNQYELCKERDDIHLIAVIETLGELANSNFADIAIVEIPDDVKWHIHEYDGLEHVAENHRTWS